MTKADRTLRRFSGYLMKRAFNAVQADVNATLHPFGLRMVTFSALVVIVDNAGLSQSQLAESLSIERPNLVLVVDELESRGLILRQRDKTDRRAYRLVPTAPGRKLCASALAAIDDHEARLTAGIDAGDRAALVAALGRIESNGRNVHEGRHVARS
ncbi:MAG: MarR family transcriptional regulator [Rhizobiaceae bacterium]